MALLSLGCKIKAVPCDTIGLGILNTDMSVLTDVFWGPNLSIWVRTQ